MQSGSNSDTPTQLIFERIADASILSHFSCGIDSMDEFIHKELQEYIWMGSCQMYIIREGEEIVAMYCLDQHNLCLSEVVKNKMKEGTKPSPQNIQDIDNSYWFKPFFDAVEITYLAVSVNRQRQHIGSFIIESIMNQVAHNPDIHSDFVTVRALKHSDYTAVPFYRSCGFFPAEEEVAGRNLFMYRVVIR